MRSPRPRTWTAAVALGLLLATGLSGCFAEILPTAPETKLQFVCHVLDPGQAERVVLDAWIEDGLTLDGMGAAQSAVATELARIGARDGGVSIRARDGPEPPRGGWNATTLAEWREDRPPEIGDEVHLHVLWVASLGGGVSMLEPSPGVVAIAQDAIQEGAGRIGRPEADVTRAVLLHAVGHALGAVNLGVPVQDADRQAREGPAGHDPDPGSVMHDGWEHAATMAWAPAAMYYAYPGALHADWAAAVRPGGICAA